MKALLEVVRPGDRDWELAQAIDPARLPAHIAIIMDGNGRRAGRRLLPSDAGHEPGIAPGWGAGDGVRPGPAARAFLNYQGRQRAVGGAPAAAESRGTQGGNRAGAGDRGGVRTAGNQGPDALRVQRGKLEAAAGRGGNAVGGGGGCTAA